MKSRINALQAQLRSLLRRQPQQLLRSDAFRPPRRPGIYRVIMPESDATLYVGISKNLRGRLWFAMLRDSPRGHVIKRKLTERRNLKRKQLMNFLYSCRIQYLVVDETRLKSLEHFAIAVLQPELND